MPGLRSLKDTMPLVRVEAQEALILDPSDRALIFFSHRSPRRTRYHWSGGPALRLATAGPSISAEAHWAYASLYFQPLGRHQEAVIHMDDPWTRSVERPIGGVC